MTMKKILITGSSGFLGSRLAYCYREKYDLQLWSALFIAFAVHLTVHVGQAVAVKSYVPGLATSLLLLPYATYGLWSIWLATNGWELIAWGTIGLAVTAANLRFAHWLGIQSDKSHLT